MKKLPGASYQLVHLAIVGHRRRRRQPFDEGQRLLDHRGRGRCRRLGRLRLGWLGWLGMRQAADLLGLRWYPSRPNFTPSSPWEQNEQLYERDRHASDGWSTSHGQKLSGRADKTRGEDGACKSYSHGKAPASTIRSSRWANHTIRVRSYMVGLCPTVAAGLGAAIHGEGDRAPANAKIARADAQNSSSERRSRIVRIRTMRCRSSADMRIL
jgi:hypothetical protein